ncbi:MAG: NADH-quinone oxidoreductase subunit N, partial [Candidatus Omnitrophica bacterium]|nr:NADH-quinone oxidoreductase subunit N [Candidatus Omnitrophota bacterium]
MIVELTLIACIGLVLVADMFFPKAKIHLLGYLTATGFVAAFLLNGLFLSKSVTAFNGAYISDSFSVIAKFLFLGIGFFVVLMTREYSRKLEKGQGEFYLLIVTATLGMSILASSMNLILIFIALEALTFSSYIMTAYLKHEASSIEAGIKYLIFGAIAACFLLLGIALIYGGAGTFDLAQVAALMKMHGAAAKWLVFGFLFLALGITFKLAAAPFHLWAPDVYQGAPTPVTAFLAVGSKTAGVILFLRIFYEVFAPIHAHGALVLSILAAVSLIYANLSALPQTNIKRLFGYSSISHAGYILMGMVAPSVSGVAYILFYLVSYAVTNLCAFFVISLQSSHQESDNIIDYRGLGKRSPFLAACLLISLLSLVGIPPTSGFVAKLFLIISAIQQGYLWLAVIAIFAAVVSVFYYLSIAEKMFLQEPSDKTPLKAPA